MQEGKLQCPECDKIVKSVKIYASVETDCPRCGREVVFNQLN